MTASTKWIYALIGFVICFYGWWIFPALWLLYIGGLVVLLVIPTKPAAAHHASPQASAAQATRMSEPVSGSLGHQEAQAIIAALEQTLDNTSDESVRRGIQLAINEARSVVNSWESASQTNETGQLMATAAGPTVVSSLPPAITPEEALAAKQRQELRNINTLLYVASFLLVGAAALFIGLGTNLPETVKFSLVLFVAVAFYAAGMALHRRSHRLQPAAVAFVGTGLALIPFVGLAFYSYVLTDGPLVWWLTSLIGLIAFWLAVIELQKPVISYLTLAFVFSLATSSVSALHAPFVWYFIAIILTGTLLQFISYLSPKWLPKQLYVPLGQNAQLATPVGLAGSLLAGDVLKVGDYTLITGISALHYLVLSLEYNKRKAGYHNWVLARALGLAFAMTLVFYLTESWKWVGFTLLTGSLVLYLTAYRLRKDEPREIGWFWASQALIVVSLLAWLDSMSQLSAGLIILGVASIHQLFVTKRAEFAIAGMIAAVLLPFTLLRGTIEPAVSYQYIALIIMLVGGLLAGLRVALGGKRRAYRQVVTAVYLIAITEAIITSLVSGESLWIGIITTAGAAILYLAAFIERQPSIHIVSNILAFFGVYALYNHTIDNGLWTLLATIWTLGIVWYALRWYFMQADSRDPRRGEIMLLSTIAAVSFGVALSVFSSETTVAAALTGCVLAGLIAYEGSLRKHRVWYEVALYIATICIQRLVDYAYPQADALLYTHWWAAVVGLAALLYMSSFQKSTTQATVRGIIALTIISVPSGLWALVQGGGYQTLFLLEHLIMAVIGVLISKKLAVQWGAIGVALSVLWLLKGYTYLLLAVLAFGLIGFAIWRLLRRS